MTGSKIDKRQQVYEQYEDALFRMAVHQLAEEEGREWEATRQRLKSLPEYQPSEEALRNFTEKLDAHLRKQRAAAWRRRAMRWLQPLAMGVLALFVIFSAAMIVQAFRVKVMNLWLEIRPQFTIFRLRENTPDPSSNGSIVDWTNAYVPTYIPEGYIIGSTSVSVSAREIVYEHITAPMIYTELGESSSPMIDTENADRVERVDINGYDGTLVQKNNLTTVLWEMDDRLFLVEVWSADDTALEVARGVKFIK